jgi:hypothetical protein
MIVNETLNNALNSPVRHINATVELFNSSSTEAINSFASGDRLKTITVDRIGAESKFFGFGISQKANIKLLDVNRELEFTTDNSFKLYLDAVKVFPQMYVTEAHRDENTNELSITMYDKLYWATEHTTAEIKNFEGSSLYSYVLEAANILGLMLDISFFNIAGTYPITLNVEGTETLLDVFNAAAEATQTVYYINNEEKLVFKRLALPEVQADLEIKKEDYITLKTSDNKRLENITHTNDLGDSLTASTGLAGSTQIIRDNIFWSLQENIDVLLENALAAVGGLTIGQFDLEWRGNYLTEPTDKIALVNKDNSICYSFIINDVLEYDGTLKQKTKWSYTEEKGEASNPTNLGEALKQTFARVDKANKQITMLTSEATATEDRLAQVEINTGEVITSVEELKKATDESIKGLNENIAEVSNKASLAVSSSQVDIKIEEALNNGVEKVTTSTGYSFDETGLKISKTNSEITTQITEDGMQVFKNNEAVLTANNRGVNAKDLHATTYLIIGNNSRFEDFNDETCCFWIGG